MDWAGLLRGRSLHATPANMWTSYPMETIQGVTLCRNNMYMSTVSMLWYVSVHEVKAFAEGKAINFGHVMLWLDGSAVIPERL